MGSKLGHNNNYKCGENDLETWCLNNGEFGQQLLDEWDYTENAKHGIFLEPKEFARGSNQRIWWRCKVCNWSWSTSINSRVRSKSNCPHCFSETYKGIKIYEQNRDNTTLLDWCNTIADKNYGMELLEQWDYEENAKNNIFVDKITYGSHKRVWWRCPECKRLWDCEVRQRTIRHTNCIKCFDDSRQGKNRRDYDTSRTSLFDWLNSETDDFKKQILQEWTGIDENGDEVDIKKIKRASGKKMKWKCSQCKNEWEATIVGRTINRVGNCPICTNKGAGTSYPEQFIYWSLKSIWPNTENRKKLFKEVDGKGFEYDIYVPETDKFKGLCIEYSGDIWHKGKEERDAYKRQLCEENGYDFIEIVEDSQDELENVFKDDYIRFKLNRLTQDEQFKAIVKYILNRYGLDDKDLDYIEIIAKAFNYSHGAIEEEKQLIKVFPELIKEIHPILNKGIKLERLTVHNHRKLYWECPNCKFGKDGEWHVQICGRVHNKGKCPKCYYSWWRAQNGEQQQLKEVKKPKVYSLAQFV